MAKDESVAGISAEDLEDLVKECRKKPHNFAMMKSKDGVVIEASPLKSCEVMARACKEAGGMPAFAMAGILNVVGKALEMTLETDEFPGNLPKLAKKHFTALKLPYKVVVILPNGQRVEGDDEGEPDPEPTVAPPVAPPGTPPGPPAIDPGMADDPEAQRKAALTGRIKAIVPGIKDATAKALPGVDRLTKGVQAAAGELAAGRLDQAERLIGAVETGLRQLTGDKTDEIETGLREKLVEEFKGLSADLRTLLTNAEKGVAGKATTLVTMFKTELNKDLKKAGQVISLLKNFVNGELSKAAPALGEKSASGPGVGENLAAPDNGDAQGETGFFDDIVQSVKGLVGSGDTATPVPTPVAEPTFVDKITKAISDGLGDLAEALKGNAKFLAMSATYPEAALAAKVAMDGYNEKLGSDLTITPDVLEKAAKDRGSAKLLLEGAEKALVTEKGKFFNGDGIKKAEKIVNDARDALKKAEEFEKAAKSKKVLDDAITTGPLSPSAPKKFSGPGALELIKGAHKDPDLTATALEAARTGEHPDAVAMNLGKVIDLKDSGFKQGTKSFKGEYSGEYAGKLLKMGASAGPDYFARMGDYMTSGRQFETNPTKEVPANSFSDLEQKRSLAVGSAMIGPDGSIDPNSDKAKNAVGDALFNPDVMRNARPAMTSHIMKTVDYLKDPANATKAGDILKAVPDPSNPAAMGLVRRATGKGDTAPVAKTDVQGAVMASMMKPLDQGPVGSCFSTAPTRRMRETDPMGAMDAFAQIAGTGKYKPPFGPEVAIVANTPPDDDPIMRSWEYSLATSTAQRASSDTNAALGKGAGAGLATLNDAIKSKNNAANSGLPPLEQVQKQQEEDQKATLRLSKLKGDVGAAFSFVYDPLDKVTDSNDGSSSQGRYVLKQISPEKEIRKKEDFIDAMTAVALASLGIDKDAPEATLIKDHVKSDAFINAIVQVNGTGAKDAYLPWQLASGGQTGEATQTLHGDTLAQHQMTGPSGDPKPDEAQRTKDVLAGFLTGMQGKTDEMVTMRTTGMHGFNALPRNPTLDKLKGDTPEAREQNITDNLIKPGEKLRDTSIPVAKALDMFTKEMKPWIDGEKDPAIKTALEDGLAAHKPTADMTPAQLTAAIKLATADANTIRGTHAADKWKLEEEGKGKVVSTTDYDDKKSKVAKSYEEEMDNSAKTRLMQDLGAPEFILADTNWGSGADHTFFVIAPDPATGDPTLWKKTVPPGKMRKATRDWIDAEWAKID